MRNKIISLLMAAVLSAGMIFAPAASSERAAAFLPSLSINAEAAAAVSAPTADKKSDYYLMDSEYLKVKLSCKTKNAAIYYKIDNGKYKKYTKTIGISKNSTLYTYAVAGGKKSKVSKYEYHLYPNYTLSVYEGDYDSDQTVKVTSKVPGVKFYYTLNGKKATSKSAAFPEKGLKIANTATLSVHAAKSGWTSSGDSYTYNINKLDNYKTYYYYNQLNSKEKKAYERLFTALQNGKNKADLTGLGLDADSVSNVLFKMLRDVDQYIYIDWYKEDWISWDFSGSECIEVTINYDTKDKKLQERQKNFEKKAAKIIAAAKKQPTAYGKLKYIHDWLVENTHWLLDESDRSVNTAEGPIINGVSVCGGYAHAFNYLAKSLGFDCIYVVSDDGTHAWNRVKLNGIWYNLDISWDDLDLYDDNKIHYENFLKSDKTFKETHLPATEYKFVSAPKDYKAS